MKRFTIIAFLTLCVFLTNFPAESAEYYTIEGLKTNFTMQVKKGWVGGNYYEIAEQLEAPIFGKPGSIKLYNQLKDMARDLDAILLYIIDPGETVPCMIRIYPARPANGMTAEKFSVDWAYSFADSLQRQGPPGTVAELKGYMGPDKLRVGGYPAVRMLVNIARPDGRFVQVNDMVELGQHIHMYSLRCDERLSKARVPEYEYMLSTVRYR